MKHTIELIKKNYTGAGDEPHGTLHLLLHRYYLFGFIKVYQHHQFVEVKLA